METKFDDLIVPPVDCITDMVTASDLADITGYTRQAFHEARKARRLWAHRLGREWIFYKPYALEYVKRMKILGLKKFGIRDN